MYLEVGPDYRPPLTLLYRESNHVLCIWEGSPLVMGILGVCVYVCTILISSSHDVTSMAVHLKGTCGKTRSTLQTPNPLYYQIPICKTLTNHMEFL